jgi:hypothetical protein
MLRLRCILLPRRMGGSRGLRRFPTRVLRSPQSGRRPAPSSANESSGSPLARCPSPFSGPHLRNGIPVSKPSISRASQTTRLFRFHRDGIVRTLPLTWTFDPLAVPATFRPWPSTTPPRAAQASTSALVSSGSTLHRDGGRLFTVEATRLSVQVAVCRDPCAGGRSHNDA